MQQEERKKRDEVKQLEKEFVDSTKAMIHDVFLKMMFESHRNNIYNIAQCFKNNQNNLQIAQECSSQQQKNHLKLEKRIEDYIKNHQEGVMDCVSTCISNIYTPMTECYSNCFKSFIEYSKLPIQKIEQINTNQQ